MANNILDFNVACAEYLGILQNKCNDVLVLHDGESMSRPFDPYYDSNDRNLVVIAMCINTVLLSEMQKPEWQCVYSSLGDIIIETSEYYDEAQRKCITGVLGL